MIYIFTGKGKGKTSAALGMVLRASGYGFRSVVVQFLKNKETGEVLRARGDDLVEIHQFGRPQWIDFNNLVEADYHQAEEAFKKCQEAAVLKPFMLVMDEFNLATSRGLVNKKLSLKFLKESKPNCHLILTGREAPREFINLADVVTDCKEIKHAYQKGIQAVKGLDF